MDTSPASASPREPAISLVVTTLGRVAELGALFESLARQTRHDFDVIVVDQNDDDRLHALLRPDRWPFPVRHVQVRGERGASRGRNRGWRLATAPVVLFPDDDCWYPADFLEQGVALMSRHDCDVLAGRAANEAGDSINGRFEPTARPTDRANVWTTAIEWMVLFRRDVLLAIDGFDETVGIGAATPWQSCEIQDIILRAMTAGFRCWFDPAWAGHHAEIVLGQPDARVLRKARAYARGMGFVLRAHGFGPAFKLKWVARPAGGAMLALLRGRGAMARYYGQVAVGRMEGLLARTTSS